MCHAARKRLLPQTAATSRTWDPALENGIAPLADVKSMDMDMEGELADEEASRDADVTQLGIAMKRMGILSMHSIPEVPAQSASIPRHPPAPSPSPINLDLGH